MPLSIDGPCKPRRVNGAVDYREELSPDTKRRARLCTTTGLLTFSTQVLRSTAASKVVFESEEFHHVQHSMPHGQKLPHWLNGQYIPLLSEDGGVVQAFSDNPHASLRSIGTLVGLPQATCLGRPLPSVGSFQ